MSIKRLIFTVLLIAAGGACIVEFGESLRVMDERVDAGRMLLAGEGE